MNGGEVFAIEGFLIFCIFKLNVDSMDIGKHELIDIVKLFSSQVHFFDESKKQLYDPWINSV
jgi:hypothetical protein